jgi:DNA-binding SARP family transcriptional activator/pimeloyl-ACP methyl ester carboxylesterase
VEFGVLGPLEVTVGGQPLALHGARTRAVLAMLLAHANQVVSADRLIDELWPGQPADRATHSLQVRLSQLRQALRSAGEEGRLVTRTPGYLIQAAAGELDATRFGQLAAEGTAALASGDAPTAAQRLETALSLWRGPAFADADGAPFAQAEAARLEEARLAALEALIDARLACGGHRGLIGELGSLTSAHPLRERFWFQRLLALYRSGRQADALRAYRELRDILAGQLGIEPGPDLRELETRILRQDSKLDYRPARRPAGEQTGPPQTRYVESGGLHIAYQVFGRGQRDIVVVPGLISHLELQWEDPQMAEFYRRLATLGRVILFDKRDTGLSDRSLRDSSLEERMDDVRAVMRAARSYAAVLFGYSEGAPMSILFAATYPERVTSLILGSAAARWSPAPDYPCGQGTADMFRAVEDIAGHRWGQGATIDWFAPSLAASPQARHMVARFERMAISPAAFLRMIRMIRAIDVRAVLPAIHAPTLVIQRAGDRITPPCHGRYLASHIAGASYFEQPGDHSLRFASSGGSDALFSEIEDFLAGACGRDHPGRVLATILLARAAGQQTMCADGQLIRSHRGRLIKATNQGILATFDGPGHAIRCAGVLRAEAAAHGIELRAGIHTGEVDQLGDQVTGASVDITNCVLPLVRPAEILVSRTVKDLVVGSGISFADRACTNSAASWANGSSTRSPPLRRRSGRAGLQLIPRLSIPARPGRADGPGDLADRLISQLPRPGHHRPGPPPPPPRHLAPRPGPRSRPHCWRPTRRGEPHPAGSRVEPQDPYLASGRSPAAPVKRRASSQSVPSGGAQCLLSSR